MCFDADAVDTWVGDMQAAGMTVPVKAGVPGIVSVSKLLRVANKVGVGDSVSFFKKNIWTTLQLFVSGQQKQTNLVGELTQFLGDDTHNLSGFHIYSFNEVEATEQWRQTAAAYERGETDMEPGQRRVISLIIDSLCDKLER
jgi:methylenetetrahydrofolate reductase (NADPH)